MTDPSKMLDWIEENMPSLRKVRVPPECDTHHDWTQDRYEWELSANSQTWSGKTLRQAIQAAISHETTPK